MKFSNVQLESLGYELPNEILYSETIEERLSSVYQQLCIPPGQITELTGVRERRIWPENTPLWMGSAQAAKKALAKSGLSPSQIGSLVYCGVCRDNLEPATACAIADSVGIRGTAEVMDVSNACLGMLNGILHVANAIELGQIQAAIVVSCESARAIIDLTIERMKQEPTMERFKRGLATMTGGSGAVALVLTHKSISHSTHRLRGGISQTAPEWHELCQWGYVKQQDKSYQMLMETEAVAIMRKGLTLGVSTWQAFLHEMSWNADEIDKLICHQVSEGHRKSILKMINMPEEKDFCTYPFLGNIGTVSLPITAAIAEERGFLQRGNKVSFLGIGSGLNCMMLGLDW